MTEGPERLALSAGLCASCSHAEILRSKRSAFLRCARAAADARFARYPTLPVLSCRGFEAAPAGGPDEQASGG